MAEISPILYSRCLGVAFDPERKSFFGFNQGDGSKQKVVLVALDSRVNIRPNASLIRIGDCSSWGRLKSCLAQYPVSNSSWHPWLRGARRLIVVMGYFSSVTNCPEPGGFIILEMQYPYKCDQDSFVTSIATWHPAQHLLH